MTQNNAPQAVLTERWDSLEGEQAMESGHLPAWRAMIKQMTESNIRSAKVLDFGCNRGGFLRKLYAEKPFAEGVGIDIATEALNDARLLKKDLPLHFGTMDDLQEMGNSFDFVFSHEVIYLLPDLASHAKDIHSWLKSGGVYYLAIGEYTENPLWPRWDSIIRKFSPVKPQTYSLQHIAKTFQAEGFTVSVSKLNCEGFFEYDVNDDKYLQSPMELVEFMTRYMMYFRFQKP
ncbi:MAG: class I SAM-dependent methyltransferase [Pseudobdellovibrionaceae bacterium]